MSEDIKILNEIEKAVKLCEKEYSRDEIFDLLKTSSESDSQIDVEKQICILKLEDIRTQQEADVLVYHLTEHHGLIREACAHKINEFMQNPSLQNFFQTTEISDALLKAVNDINPNICRLIIDVLPYLKDKKYFLNNLYNRFDVIFDELEKLKRSNWYTKKLFNLYWGLEALCALSPDCDSKLQNVLQQCLKIREYTIREKTAMLLDSLKSDKDFINQAKQLLAQDTNYYVKRYAKNWV